MPVGNPNFYTVDPNGNATADFAGHVSARGIDLIAGDAASPPADRKIQWHKTDNNGAVVAEIVAYDVPAFDEIDVSALGRAGYTGVAYLKASADNLPNIYCALIAQQTTAQQSASSYLLARMDGAQNGVQETILSADNKSSYLRFRGGALGTVRSHKINYGFASMNFPTSTNSDATVVGHGLGVAPAMVVCMALQAPNYNQIPVYSLSASDATNFTVIGFVPVARTGAISFYWVAIG